jgi:hypothetical protein
MADPKTLLDLAPRLNCRFGPVLYTRYLHISGLDKAVLPAFARFLPISGLDKAVLKAGKK